jgi:cell division protein FtsN
MNPLVTAEFEQNKKAVDQDVKDDAAKLTEDIPGVIEEPAQPVTINPVYDEENTYFLITGSFKSEENATSQLNMLKEAGFSPEIVSAPNGFYRVCAMACTDMNTAVLKKDSIAKKFPGTWISRKK